MQKNPIWRFSQWEGYTDIIHGISTISFGDCVIAENQKKFLTALKLPYEQSVSAEQVHNNRVHLATKKDTGKQVARVDALVLGKASDTKNMSLMIRIADCVPIFFYDTNKHMIALAHAGWQGIVGHIEKAVIDTMIQNGSEPQDIHIGIGPHIGPCCYNVNEDRADQFSREFGDEVMIKREQRWFVDFDACLLKDASRAGILEKNIIRANVCTYDAKDAFFSYRRNPKDFGEMIAVIGF